MDSGLGTYSVSSAPAQACVRLAVETWRACHPTDDAGEDAFARRYAWFYEGNPAGPAMVHFLHHVGSSNPVGMLSVAPRQVEFRGAAYRAGLLFDFVVSNEHRTAFPALLLQRHAHAQALREGPLYGLPSDKAVPIFRRLHARISTPRHRFARVVRSGPYLKRIAPAWLADPACWVIDSIGGFASTLRTRIAGTRVEWVDSPDQRFEQLWQRARGAASVLGIRDRQFLQWRFFSCQPGRFRALLAATDDLRSPHTYFICDLTGSALVVRDLLSWGDQEQICAALHALTGEARRLGVSVVNIPVLADARYIGALRGARFSSREQQPCFVFAANAGDTLANADWYLTTADEDI